MNDNFSQPNPLLTAAPAASGARELLTLSDASKLTKVSIRKLQLEMAAGGISYIKIGRLTRFYPDDLHSFLRSRRISSRHKSN